MRRSYKCFAFCLAIIAFLLNIYIISLFFSAQEDFDYHLINNQRHFQFFYGEKNDSEFLIVDWTASRHIFKEKDPIPCNFSHVDLNYCQSKFDSIVNTTLRSNLIERCLRLSKLTIRWTLDRSKLKIADLVTYHSMQLPSKNLPDLIRNDKQQQFSMVNVLESEVNSMNGIYWHKIDFPVWYNLERSFPEPATYFDIKTYLDYLFSPIKVPFSQKTEKAPIVWVISNCFAYNGRHKLVRALMSYIHIDSYGRCLNNIASNIVKSRRESNTVLYSRYKFVLAIENSNCEDYVTEKLIDAFASTSIPIIASRNNKPDYTRFAPKYSYINVYDYRTVEDLANYLNYLSNNKTAYEEYLWFRRLPFNKYTTTDFTQRSLAESLNLSDEILGVNATMRYWLLNKETNVNKYCKVTKFIYTNHWKSIYERERINRPTANEVCLPQNDLATYFSL